MTNDIQSHFDEEWFEGIYLQYYSGYSIHYCVNTKARNETFKLGYDTWIKPLDKYSWTWMIHNYLDYGHTNLQFKCTIYKY